jgi:hypothetical protein
MMERDVQPLTAFTCGQRGFFPPHSQSKFPAQLWEPRVHLSLISPKDWKW